MDWVYDLETYPNIFTFCVGSVDGKESWVLKLVIAEMIL